MIYTNQIFINKLKNKTNRFEVDAYYISEYLDSKKIKEVTQFLVNLNIEVRFLKSCNLFETCLNLV